MRLQVVGKTDIGSVREENQDALGEVRLDEESAFLVVADGMGGYAGGSLAARLAVETLLEYVKSSWTGKKDPRSLLREAVAEANARVRERAMHTEGLADMGTTCVCALVSGSRCYLAHVGDSRAYLFRRGLFTLLTEDHTVIQQLINQGKVKPQEASYHPSAGILMRCLGQLESVEPDVSGPIELQEGDRLLLCSDGLTGMVYEDEIAEVLKGRDMAQVVEELVRMANEAGGFDNITVQILQAGTFPEDAATWPVIVDSPEGIALMAAEGRLPKDPEELGHLRHTRVLEVVREPAVESEETVPADLPEWDPGRERFYKLLVTAAVAALLAGGLVYFLVR